MKRTFNVLYPVITTILAYACTLFLLILDRFDWPLLTGISVTGLVIGAAAEIIMIVCKTDLTVYLKKILLTILGAAGFWIIANCILKLVADKYLEWGWWYSAAGIAAENAILFAPAVVTSVILLFIGKKPVDKTLLVMTNPVTHAAVWWYIVDTLLSCLPT